MSDLIRAARLHIASIGGSELNAVANNEGLAELFKKKQELTAEMNIAKRKAMEAAALPYLETIKEIDETYTLLLTLSGATNEQH